LPEASDAGQFAAVISIISDVDARQCDPLCVEQN
jgi:hypothetical protein